MARTVGQRRGIEALESWIVLCHQASKSEDGFFEGCLGTGFRTFEPVFLAGVLRLLLVTDFFRFARVTLTES